MLKIKFRIFDNGKKIDKTTKQVALQLFFIKSCFKTSPEKSTC